MFSHNCAIRLRNNAAWRLHVDYLVDALVTAARSLAEQGAEAEAEKGRDGGWREALEILEMIVRCIDRTTLQVALDSARTLHRGGVLGAGAI